MATIMSWGNSDGTKGRCDAKCHNATGPNCKCMCGGKYHGASNRPGGVEEAVRRTADEVIDEAERRAEREGVTLDTKRLRDLIGQETNCQGELPLGV